MKAGRLRHVIEVERLVSGQDAYGGPISEWAHVGSFHASVKPLRGREYFAAQATQSEVTTEIMMRYHPGITASDRITHKGTVYDILSIINTELRNEELILMCKSR